MVQTMVPELERRSGPQTAVSLVSRLDLWSESSLAPGMALGSASQMGNGPIVGSWHSTSTMKTLFQEYQQTAARSWGHISRLFLGTQTQRTQQWTGTVERTQHG